MDKKIFRWEIIGIFIIFGVGTTLHFWFEWTGYWRPIAVIAAVNESTWEHFKMAFWPGLFIGIIEYFVWGKKIRNFFTAKFLGLLAMPIITMILFYGYTIFWHHNLPADVVVFAASITGGQLLSMYLLRREKLQLAWLRYLSIAGLLLMTAAFSTQSYFPRENFVFAHPESGEYGILDDYSDHDHGGEDDDHDDDHDDEH